MDFRGSDDLIVDNVSTLTSLCTKFIVNKIDETIKKSYTAGLPIQLLIERINEFVSPLHFVAREVIHTSLIAKCTYKIYYRYFTHTQYHDGRILSSADILNNPDRHTTCPWKILEPEQLIARYCTTYYAYKARMPHPFAPMIDVQMLGEAGPVDPEGIEELALSAD